MQFNITLTEWHNVVLKLLWLKDVNLKISFQYRIIDFSTEKLIHISKEMHESELEICAISADKLNRKI